MASGKSGRSIRVIFITILLCWDVRVGGSKNATRWWSDSNSISLRQLQDHFDSRSLTLSGLGNGGGFAQIIHLSHSSIFIGLILVSSTFYKCGGVSPSFDEWSSKCGVNYKDEPYSVDNSSAEATALAKAGKLDPLENLKHQRLFIYTTTDSETSNFDLCFQTLNIYEPKLLNPTQTSTRVWIGKVFDQPDRRFSSTRRHFEGFTFILPHRKIYFPRGTILVSQLIRFNQREFFEGDETIHHFADEGFVYIPSNCRLKQKKCVLHLKFHDCRGNSPIEPGPIVDTLIRAMAEINNIIVVFPQIKPTPQKGGYEGCFDFFGYTGNDYATKDGVQIRIIRNMLEALLGIVID